MGVSPLHSNSQKLRRRLAGLAALFLPIAALHSANLNAQEGIPEDAPATAQAVVLADVPGERHLAAALADEVSRGDTLLTLAAVARMLEYGSQADPARVGELEARFRDDRAWLDRLTARFSTVPMRPALLDPAAWFLSRELDKQGLSSGVLASPLGPDTGSLVRQVFDRGDELLAATLLPELLTRMELQSTTLWALLLERLPSDPALAALVTSLNSDWFEPWVAAEPPAPAADGGEVDIIGEGVARLGALAGTVTTVGPPDALRLKRLRFNLLMALPDLSGPALKDATYLLTLASAIDGLYRREYLEFTESLLWVIADLLLTGSVAPESPSRLPPLLTGLLPGLSNAYAGGFSEVDPRINTSLATVFDAAQYLQSAAPESARLISLRSQVADVIAQLVWQIPDLDYYYEQPVRERIGAVTDRCIGIVMERDASGGSMSREQFESCLDGLVAKANDEVSSSELAGDPDGPFGRDQLRRELMLTPWQRVNFVLGYLHDQHPTGCALPEQPLPNPVEWSNLATLMVWLAQQSPVYFQTPQSEARVVEMRRRGMALLDAWVQQVDCISAAGGGLNDPVSRGLADYRQELDQLVAGLREAELELRAARLKPGADVVLHGDADQRTAFRSEALQIVPCSNRRVCEMSAALKTTRALIGLFPDPYLIADQTRLGEVEICYDNVQWVNRRSEPVRSDDPHVANYFGQLSFDLVGRYREGDEVTNVFGFTYVTPAEYHYLFAAADQEVLDDNCPTEWVGSRIVTPMTSGQGLRIVPNRLTYLAAARTLPSLLITSNWNRNEEWRDRFVTGLDVTPLVFPPDPSIRDRVNQHLQAMYQAEQSALYNALFRPPSRAGDTAADSLYDQLEELTAGKALLRSYINLFYPQFMVDSSEIRAALEGQGSLLERSVLQRFRERKVAVSSTNEVGLERLEQFRALWNRQPEAVRRSGNHSISVVHAISRLNSVYMQFFAPPQRDREEVRGTRY